MQGLYLGDAPHLSGESAALVVDLLRVIADEIDHEYAAQILGIRRRAWLATPTRWPPWARPVTEEQLSLDLDDMRSSDADAGRTNARRPSIR